MRHGQGKVYFKDGNLSYSGNFKNGKYDGYGTSFTRSGSIIYEGQWKDGIHDGVGKLFFESGIQNYEGKWKGGLFEDYGKKYNESGNLLYEGQFKNGKPNGEGKVFYDNENLRYQGKQCDGQPHGVGKFFSYQVLQNEEGVPLFNHLKKMIIRSYLKYSGEFVHGKINGSGRMYNTNGTIEFEGKFQDNQPVNEFGKKLNFEGEIIGFKNN